MLVRGHHRGRRACDRPHGRRWRPCLSARWRDHRRPSPSGDDVRNLPCRAALYRGHHGHRGAGSCRGAEQGLPELPRGRTREGRRQPFAQAVSRPRAWPSTGTGSTPGNASSAMPSTGRPARAPAASPRPRTSAPHATPRAIRMSAKRDPATPISAFDTCATAGCHNYHDNRALYEDFLLRHAAESWLAPVPAHPLAALTRAERKPSQEPRRLDAATTAIAAALRKPIPAEWAGTGHAKAGVSCFACHAPETTSGQTPAEILWTDAPSTAVCENCHQRQGGRFRARTPRNAATSTARGPARAESEAARTPARPPSSIRCGIPRRPRA